MKIELLQLLVDPFGQFTPFEIIDIQIENTYEILYATLRSKAGNYYPVINGIPRILSPELLIELVPGVNIWLTKYYTHLCKDKILPNIQAKVANSFYAEWKKFSSYRDDFNDLFKQYFALWNSKKKFGQCVLDAGCGMGRWAKFAANRTEQLLCVDISQAIDVARQYLPEETNVHFIQANLTNLPFRNGTFDAAYSLGVLHHIPDTKKAFFELSRVIKSDGDLLTYIYYALENRPYWFKLIFYMVNMIRLFISRLPKTLSHFLSFLLASFIYLPLICFADILYSCGFCDLAKKVPLYEFYKNKSFYIIYNDAIDRFTTPLEKRFSKEEIEKMYRESGFKSIIIQQELPFWVSNAKKMA